MLKNNCLRGQCFKCIFLFCIPLIETLAAFQAKIKLFKMKLHYDFKSYRNGLVIYYSNNSNFLNLIID